MRTEKQKILLGDCNTRWSARDKSYEHIHLALSYIVELLVVRNRKHPKIRDLHKIHTDIWHPKVKKEATSYIKALTYFPFIVGLIKLY